MEALMATIPRARSSRHCVPIVVGLTVSTMFTFACTRAVEPVLSQPDQYLLLSLEGRALPTYVGTAGSDSLVYNLLVFSTVSSRSTETSTLRVANANRLISTSVTRTFTRNGNTVVVDFSCTADAICIAIGAPTVGTIHGDTLDFPASTNFPARKYRYLKSFPID
jgi:hypothetical protein